MSPESGWSAGEEFESGLDSIETPKGPYSVESDDLVEELKAAARFARLSKFKVFINGTQIEKPDDLPCTELSALPAIARFAGVDCVVKVVQYDKAA